MIPKKLYTPVANPVRFFNSKENQPDEYKSKYAPGDVTDLQFCSIGAPLTVSLQLLGMKNKVVKTLEVTTTTKNNNNFYTAEMSFESLFVLPEGFYRFRLTAEGGDETVTLWSNVLCVNEANKELTLLHWNNSYTKGSVDYSLIKYFSMRIEGGFLPKGESPKSEQTQYQNQRRQYVTLFAETYSTHMFTVGMKGVPYGVLETVHEAFSCDDLYIDRLQYAKYEDAAWESEELGERYPNRNWKIEMIRGEGEMIRGEGEMTDDVEDTYVFEFEAQVNPNFNISKDGQRDIQFTPLIVSSKNGVPINYSYQIFDGSSGGFKNTWIRDDEYYGGLMVVPNFDEARSGYVIFTQAESGMTLTINFAQEAETAHALIVEYDITEDVAENRIAAMPVTSYSQSTFGVKVSWGDGNYEPFTDDRDLTHLYAQNGVYTLKFIAVGDGYNKISCNKANAKNRVTKVIAWGEHKVTTVADMFYDCQRLTYVPPSWDATFENVENFSNAFRNTSLETAPAGLFYNCKNAISTSVMFASCKNLTTIEAGLFDDFTNVTEFNSVFYYCTALQHIPDHLFKYCTKVNSFIDTFKHCTNLIDIPSTLFEQSYAARNFNSIFYECSSLSEIPEGLFDNCNSATSFYNTFKDCINLEFFPQELFYHCVDVIEFSGVFSGCVRLSGSIEDMFINCADVESFFGSFQNCRLLTGSSPISDGKYLWERAGQPGYPGSIDGASCFSGCINLSDYSTIPQAWGGLGQ
jgi:hypothetical protein